MDEMELCLLMVFISIQLDYYFQAREEPKYVKQLNLKLKKELSSVE